MSDKKLVTKQNAASDLDEKHICSCLLMYIYKNTK